jgi:hypothetical protein
MGRADGGRRKAFDYIRVKLQKPLFLMRFFAFHRTVPALPAGAGRR